MLRASYALVQATVGVGTVIIPYIGVAYTRGGGTQVESFVHFLLKGFKEELDVPRAQLEEIKILECGNIAMKFYLDGRRFRGAFCALCTKFV